VHRVDDHLHPGERALEAGPVEQVAASLPRDRDDLVASRWARAAATVCRRATWLFLLVSAKRLLLGG
jgi:hypothetical protein